MRLQVIYNHTLAKTKDLKSPVFTLLQKKGWGRGACLVQFTGHERLMRVPTPVGTDRQSQVTTHAPARCGFRSCRWVSPSDFQPPPSNLQGATDHGPRATSALCESRLPSGRTTGHNSLITSPIYFLLALRSLRIVDLAHC